jgi:hypothetical protein
MITPTSTRPHPNPLPQGERTAGVATATDPSPKPPLGALRNFIRNPVAAVRLERCQLCSAPIAAEHSHLVEIKNRQIVCACEACAVLFDGREGTPYRRVPRDARQLADFQLTDAQWDSLLIPINMAFFFHSTLAGRVIAIYPSPAGATESLLTLEAWGDLVAANPALANLQPDVEALLVKRLSLGRGGDSTDNRGEYFVTPIDKCYELTGLIRKHWRGFTGGTEVWTAIDNFFARLRAAAAPVSLSAYGREPACGEPVEPG